MAPRRYGGLALVVSTGLHLSVGLHISLQAPTAGTLTANLEEPAWVEMDWVESIPDPEPSPEPPDPSPPEVLPEPAPTPLAVIQRPRPLPRDPSPEPSTPLDETQPNEAEPNESPQDEEQRGETDEAQEGDARSEPSSDPGTTGPGLEGPSTAQGTEGPAVGPPSFDPAQLLPGAVARQTFGPRNDVSPREQRRRDLEAALNADLYRAANALPHETVRPPPRLRPTGDGGYAFEGHLFDATISPEGEVRFSDMPAIQFGGFPLNFVFDLTTLAEEAAGNDPHIAERRWFIDGTRNVRRRLVAETRAHEEGRGLVRLRHALRNVWARSESASARRRQIFSMWDECAEDEIGQRARTAILEFVGTHLRGEDAYPPAELARLNAGRHSEAAFVPPPPQE